MIIVWEGTTNLPYSLSDSPPEHILVRPRPTPLDPTQVQLFRHNDSLLSHAVSTRPHIAPSYVPG
jgi:hypothetical protein